MEEVQTSRYVLC